MAYLLGCLFLLLCPRVLCCILVGWMPFYWLIKCLFMIWCMAPLENNRSEIIYARVFCPILPEASDKD